MKRLIIIVLLFITNSTATLSKELRLAITSKPLSEVLGTLDLELSFDHEALSQLYVSVNKTFNSPSEALSYLLEGLPLTAEKIGNVYVIYPKEEVAPQSVKAKPEISYYHYTGTISDSENGETLPYAHITTGKGVVVGDEYGRFSINSINNQAIQVQVQYLGYEDLDTLLQAGTHSLPLRIKPTYMREAVIMSPSTSMLMQSGKTSGELRLNHQVAKHIPGSTDNSVFNLLRMMPGVRASGEPSGELIVWGNSLGESQFIFDGFTLYGLKNFNDNISCINPYMVKDVRLLKGGYDVSYNNRIGAIAELTGVEGNRQSLSAKATLSNLTANMFVSTPIAKHAVLAIAYRQTFYNLYNSTLLNPYGNHSSGNQWGNTTGATYSITTSGIGNGGHGSNAAANNVYIEPSYSFRDFNLKYVGRLADSDRYFASLYAADDRFKFSLVNASSFEINASEKNRQLGGVVGYEHVWSNSSTSKLSIARSQLNSEIDNVESIQNNHSLPQKKERTDNLINELSVKLTHRTSIRQRHQIQTGVEWNHFICKLNAAESMLSNPALFASDEILMNKLNLKLGVRVEFPDNHSTFILPRIAASYALSENLNATASWGMYKQATAYLPFKTESGSYQLAWQLTDRALASTHYIAGIAYSKNNLLVNLEGYFKNRKNATGIYMNTSNSTNASLLGVDLFVKKNIEKHSFYGSYSVAKVSSPIEELGKELKLGGIAALPPFYVSASYVHGSGFPYLTSQGGHGMGHGNKQASYETNPYNRLDIAASYELQLQQWTLKAGISILNVTNSNNVKYGQQYVDNNVITNVYTKAITLTPIFFIEVLF